MMRYIIKRTDHPVATGGSPIVTWLPNQLTTVLDVMLQTEQKINRSQVSIGSLLILDEIIERAEAQRKIVAKEVASLRGKFGN